MPSSPAETINSNPFGHVAYVLAASDTTFRFEKARLVSVPVRFKHIADEAYCAEIAHRDAGGSMFCPYTEPESWTTAYEVIYSFVGPPMASDEFGDRRYTFTVYIRPEELSPEVRKALSVRNPSRSDLAGYFALSTSRETVQQVAIDHAQSKFCPGNYVDGAWTHSDSGCEDDIRYTLVTVPSDYTTVRVEPTPKRGHDSRSAANHDAPVFRGRLSRDAAREPSLEIPDFN